MEKPFANFDKQLYHDYVILRGFRPTIDASWGKSLTGFISSCWDQDLTKRPSADRASNLLKREVAKISDGRASDLNNFRRKSTFKNVNALWELRMELKAATNAVASPGGDNDPTLMSSSSRRG